MVEKSGGDRAFHGPVGCRQVVRARRVEPRLPYCSICGERPAMKVGQNGQPPNKRNEKKKSNKNRLERRLSRLSSGQGTAPGRTAVATTSTGRGMGIGPGALSRPVKRT